MFITTLDLNTLVKKLDKRSLKNATNCQLKPRVPSTPSSQGPLDGALRWALNNAWLQDKENAAASPPAEAVSTSVQSARKVLDFQSESDSSQEFV